MNDELHREAGSKEITSLTEQLLHAYEELDLLHSVCEILSETSEPDEANKHILREAMATLEADVGWLVYHDGQQRGHHVLRQNIDARTAEFLNETIVQEAIAAGHHVWTDNLAQEIAAPAVKVPRAFLCVPLRTRTETLGAICLGKQAEGAVFTAGDLKLVQILCAPAANAILHRRVERTSELKRYVSPQLADSILSGGDVQLRNKRAELTMFLAELKGFTEAAEEIEPEELVEILNEYLSVMTEIVFAHEGTLDKFVIGSIFGFFGDPVAQEDHAIRAVHMAMDMQHRFAELAAKWRAEGYKPFGLGIGINTGYVTVGHIGSSNRTDYTAIGKSVLVASTLAGLAEPGQILMGPRTFAKTKNAALGRLVATIDIGTQPTKVYEVWYEKGQPHAEPVPAPVAAPPVMSTSGHIAFATNGLVSHYRVVGKLGQGGMGEVYKAEDVKLDRTVALKILSHHAQDDESKRRFVREAKALSALNHPNIATIYEIDDCGGVSFIAMEYIDGRTLKDLIAAKEFTLREALDIAIPVAEALANAHVKNIIHRDIKPTNIMVSDVGYVKVLDFGLAKSIDTGQSHTGAVTQGGMVWGTVPYMSPEQAMGTTLDQRSDIFSFGSVLYEVITRQPAFAGDNSMAILHAVTFEQPAPISRLRPDAAGEMERVVNKTLQKKASERYQTLQEALVDLKRLRSDLSA